VPILDNHNVRIAAEKVSAALIFAAVTGSGIAEPVLPIFVNLLFLLFHEYYSLQPKIINYKTGHSKKEQCSRHINHKKCHLQTNLSYSGPDSRPL
jgi:hypothetical protein